MDGMGADGGDDDILRRGLHNGAASGHGVGRGAGGRADNDAVAGEGRGLHAVALHRELNHPGNGALGDGGVVERQLVKEHLSLAAHRGAEHHALFHPVVVGREPGEELQLPGLQLRHKAHGADVDAEDGHMVTGGNLGGVENGAVAAKADEQIRILNFR